MRRIFLPATAVLIVGLVVLLHGHSTIQAGHSHNEVATCAAGLTATASSYQGGSLVMVLGPVVYTARFETGYNHTIPNSDMSKAQAWRVTVTSSDGAGNFETTGTIPACQTPTTASTPSTSTIASSTTSVTTPTTPSASTTAAPSTAPRTVAPTTSTTGTTSSWTTTRAKPPTLIPRTR